MEHPQFCCSTLFQGKMSCSTLPDAPIGTGVREPWEKMGANRRGFPRLECWMAQTDAKSFTWELLNGLGICWFPCIGRASAVLWHVMLYLRYKEAIEPESKQWLSHRKGRNQQFNFQLIETIIIWTIEILTAPLRSPCFCMPRFAEEAQVVFQKSQDKCGEAHFI